MLRAYKYRLYPNDTQKSLIEKHFGCARWVYNWALAKRIDLYTKSKLSISRFDLQKLLPGLKQQPETSWLSEVSAQSLQAVLGHLDMAYTSFFRTKDGFPKFKSKSKRQSFQVAQCSHVDFEAQTVSVLKIPNIRAVIDRDVIGKIKTVTISRVPSGKYYASVLVDDGKELPAPKSEISAHKTVGVDLGLKHFATLSTGEKIENPRHLKWSTRKLCRAQRQLSRKKLGSKNRDKCRKNVALIHERVANQRRDFHHKLSTRLIRENQAVALETLNVSGMQKNHRLAKSISDAGWTQFVSMLEYKAQWYGKTILRIGKFEPSSKLCTCGVVNKSLTLAQREWTCSSCGSHHDRDILAANNIKRMALHPLNFLGQGMAEFKPVEPDNSRSLKQESVGAS